MGRQKPVLEDNGGSRKGGNVVVNVKIQVVGSKQGRGEKGEEGAPASMPKSLALLLEA
jgi:hypothetical protein